MRENLWWASLLVLVPVVIYLLMSFVLWDLWFPGWHWFSRALLVILGAIWWVVVIEGYIND